ncbi:hypothetical protein HDU98_008790, partial [Podochytrium sp. JEL0797]
MDEDAPDLDEEGEEEEEVLSFFGSKDDIGEAAAATAGVSKASKDGAKCEKDWPKIAEGSFLDAFVNDEVGKMRISLRTDRKIACYDNCTFWIHPKDGFAHNPTGRIVCGSPNYVLVTYGYECKKCVSFGGRTKSFYGSSMACLSAMDPEVAGNFRPILTKKGGMDRDFTDWLIPCFMGGLGPQRFHAAMKETASKRYERNELNWVMAVNRKVANGRSVAEMLGGKTSRSVLEDVPVYPIHGDPATYVECTPSANYVPMYIG